MTRSLPSVMIVGQFWHGSLEGSYARAFESLGCQVTRWDLPGAIQRHTRLRRLGKFINTFWPVEAWINKANRELILAARENQPDLILIGGAGMVRAGALAQIKVTLPDTRLVLLWPDNPLRLMGYVIHCLPLYDLVATYSQSTVEVFARLGAPRVEWTPLAADLMLHSAQVAISDSQRQTFTCDVGFVGNHRPEREEAVRALLAAGVSVKVWGHDYWRRDALDPKKVRLYWQGQPLYGDDFARAVRCSQISLNPIDPTNYPAANMRFFEILACGGVALNSACPDMEQLFPDGVAAFYYQSSAELVDIVREILQDETRRRAVALAGHQQVLKQHTYVHRAAHILQCLGVDE